MRIEVVRGLTAAGIALPEPDLRRIVSDGETIDFIYGVINWKEIADSATSLGLNGEVGRAIAAGLLHVEVHDLRRQIFAALQRLSINYFENRSTGEIMSRVTNDTEHVERIFIDGLEGMLTASLTLMQVAPGKP